MIDCRSNDRPFIVTSFIISFPSESTTLYLNVTGTTFLPISMSPSLICAFNLAVSFWFDGNRLEIVTLWPLIFSFRRDRRIRGEILCSIISLAETAYDINTCGPHFTMLSLPSLRTGNLLANSLQFIFLSPTLRDASATLCLSKTKFSCLKTVEHDLVFFTGDLDGVLKQIFRLKFLTVLKLTWLVRVELNVLSTIKSPSWLTVFWTTLLEDMTICSRLHPNSLWKTGFTTLLRSFITASLPRLLASAIALRTPASSSRITAGAFEFFLKLYHSGMLGHMLQLFLLCFSFVSWSNLSHSDFLKQLLNSILLCGVTNELL